MPTQPPKIPANKQTYIPPEVIKALSHHMENSIPTGIRQYSHDGRLVLAGHTEASMTKQMEATTPDHMKQYIGPYLKQAAVFPNTAVDASSAASRITPAAPTPLHSDQNLAKYNENLQAADQTASTDQTGQNSAEYSTYDFITNPAPKPRSPIWPGSTSMAWRALFFSVGVCILLILFIVVKSILTPAPKLSSLIPVYQDQQELIHLSNDALQQTNLSSGITNLATTIQLSVTSAQIQIGSYLSVNKIKVSTTELNLKVSSIVDEQLTAALTAGTYNSTFQNIIVSQLNIYDSDLKSSYAQINDQKIRALLSSDFHQTQLMTTQADAPEITTS